MFAARKGDDGPFVPVLRFGEVARQASALARGLAYFLEDSGTDRIFLALATRSRPEWIMADLAAIERGYVVVPISPDEPDARLASILARCRPAAMLVEQADAARLAALVTRVCPSLTLLVVCGAPGDEARRPDAAPGGESSVVSASDENGQEEGPVQVRFEDLVWQGQSRGATPPPAPRTGEDLYSLLFTSGSTGEPKGAMRSYAAFHAMLASYGVPQPAFHLSFQPLSHLSERMYLPAVLIHGGTVAFSRGGAFLMDELHAFEPTVLGSVPRLFDVLHARFLRRLAASGAPEGGTATEDATRAARQEAREAFGRRLMALSVGSAPVSPVVLAFLRQTFADIWVTEGYGTTEVGSITGNGQLSGRVRLKLVPLPGEAPANPARGEIWVHSPHTISGYFEDPEATAAALDADGFFRTGDLGERLPDGAIRVIGRLRSAVKLAHGEFVSAERTESALCTAPVVDRIFVLAEPGASGAAALVFPERDALAALLDAGDAPLAALVRREEAAGAVLAALHRHGAQAGLAPHELPREVVLDPVAPSVEAGLLTASGKLARAALAARLAARLAGPALVAEPVAALPPAPPDPTAPAGSPESALAARLARAATATLGRPVSTREPLASSLDSLAAAALLAALAEDLQQPVPLPLWFACASLADLAGRLSPTWPRPAADDPLESALARAVLQDLVLPPVFSRPGVHPGKDSDLSLPIVAKDPALSPPVAPPAMDTHVLHPGAVLLTGATGFLGVHLIESLLARTSHEVICLVRGADEAQASGRLRGVMARHGVADSPRIRVVAGDLSRPRLGLTEPEFAALAGRVGAVLHAGAEVSWLAPYAALRGANVDGSRTAHSLALLGRVRPFHLVSTISTAPAAGEEDSLLSLEQSLHGSPYAVSKWVAEQHARRAMAAGYPVAIYRPAMIAPHSRRGVANPKDFLHRYLTGSLALGLYLDLPAELLDMTPVDFVADAIVALLSASPGGGDTYHLVNIEQSLSYTEIGRALARAGLPLRPADYTSFRAALLSAGPQADELRALASFFPATGFSLGMGPWPSARTRHRLAGLGVRCPAIDAAYLLRLIGR
jgi:fatty acid CoA ligase FadD9